MYCHACGKMKEYAEYDTANTRFIPKRNQAREVSYVKIIMSLASK